MQAYLKAMEAVAQRNPADDEAQMFYAITLNVAASPNDKTYANQLKGAAILEPIFKRQPRHPGVAHYLIHLYDSPALAEKGIDAAKRYAEIAPAAPHAQHMPSHIFTRVGYWNESIGSNTAAARAAKADKEFTDQLHAMDYMVYAYLQLAQDSKARDVVDEMNAITGVNPNVLARPVCACRLAGALHGGTRRLEGGGGAAGPANTVRPCPGDDAFRARLGGGPLRQSGRGQGRHRQARRVARQAARGQGRLLGGAGRHPVAGRDRIRALCRGQA